MEPPRVPVPRAANPSHQRSASSSERNDGGSEPELSDESRRSEPGAEERGRLKEDTIPLQDIKDMVKRIQLHYEKVKRDKKKESARKSQQKKQKAKEAREAREAREAQGAQEAQEAQEAKKAQEDRAKLDELRQGASAILAAVDTEVGEVRSSKFTIQLEAMLGAYLRQEAALLGVIRDKILVPEPDEAARASAYVQLVRLQGDIDRDVNLTRWPVLKILHTQRLMYIRTAMQF